MGKRRKGHIARAYKSMLRNDRDCDFAFLLELEQTRLKRMASYFAKSGIAEDHLQVARELSLCVRLLDIVMEKERLSEEWFEKSKDCRTMLFPRKDGCNKCSYLEFEYTAMPPRFPHLRQYTQRHTIHVSP